MGKVKKETLVKAFKKELPPIRSWSFSAANEDSQCSLKRVLERLHREKTPLAKFLKIEPYKGDTQPREVGSAVHLFMEDYEHHCYKKRVERDENEAKKIKGAVLAKTELPTEMQDDYGYIVDNLIKYRKFNMTVQSWPEQKISFKIEKGHLVRCDYKDPKAIIKGMIDRIYRPYDEKGTWVFTDYKTNRIQFGAEDVDKIKQLKFYAVLLDEMYPEYEISKKPVILNFDFLRMGKNTEIIFDVNKERDELLTEIINYVYEFGNKIKNFLKKIDEMGNTREEVLEYMARFFEPRVNRYCSCDFFMCCPVYRKAMETMDVDIDTLRPSTIKFRKDALDKQNTASLSHLKAVYKRQGPIKSDGYVYGRFEKEKVVYDIDLVLERFKERVLSKMKNDEDKEVVSKHIDILKNIEIGKTAMDKAISKNELIALCSDGAKVVEAEHKWDWVLETEKKVWK